jgi:hypothetical protein
MDKLCVCVYHRPHENHPFARPAVAHGRPGSWTKTQSKERRAARRLDPWTWERAPESYAEKLVTLKGELVNIIPDSRRLLYRYILSAKWKREPNPAIEIDEGDSGEIQVPVYFSANLRDIRKDAQKEHLILEVKGRVASDGSQAIRVSRDGVTRREYRVRGDLAICSAELVSKEKTNDKTERPK